MHKTLLMLMLLVTMACNTATDPTSQLDESEAAVDAVPTSTVDPEQAETTLGCSAFTIRPKYTLKAEFNLVTLSVSIIDAPISGPYRARWWPVGRHTGNHYDLSLGVVVKGGAAEGSIKITLPEVQAATRLEGNLDIEVGSGHALELQCDRGVSVMLSPRPAPPSPECVDCKPPKEEPPYCTPPAVLVDGKCVELPPPPPVDICFCHIASENNVVQEITLCLPPPAADAHLREHIFDYPERCDGRVTCEVVHPPGYTTPEGEVKTKNQGNTVVVDGSVEVSNKGTWRLDLLWKNGDNTFVKDTDSVELDCSRDKKLRVSFESNTLAHRPSQGAKYFLLLYLDGTKVSQVALN